MKKLILNCILIVNLIGSVCADVFHVGRVREAGSNEFVINPEALKTLEAALGKDATYRITPDWEGAQTARLIYGRLIGVVKGEVVGAPGYSFSNDTLRIQVLTEAGELVGAPVSISTLLLNPFTRFAEFDTLWDFERFYGSIAGSFETELGSELFDMALMGILDPTGEMGLNTLKVAVDLPDDFTHGWLTHFVYFGKADSLRQSDPFNLAAVNAFDPYFIGEGAAHTLHHTFHWGGAPTLLIEHLARDAKYKTYEPGVREQVIKIIGLMLDFSRVDPSTVQDPELRERAKRVAFLGAQTQSMIFNTMDSRSHYPKDDPYGGNRNTTLVERAHALFDVMEALRPKFDLHNKQVMELLLNAGVDRDSHGNRPHPDCAERAYALYFDLIATGQRGENEDENFRLLKSAKQRRSFAVRALMPGILNDDAAFTARTRAAFNRIGYGSTEEVQAIVDALDLAIPKEYMGEEIYNKNLGLAVPTFEFNEIAAPSGLGLGSPAPVVHEEEVSFAVNFHGHNLSDEAALQESLIVLKDIAYNLPEDTIGRSSKMRIVENWRQIQVEELEASLERQFQPIDGPPPELSPKQKQFKRELTDNWKAPDGASGDIEI